jgi:hypothetical protein
LVAAAGPKITAAVPRPTAAVRMAADRTTLLGLLEDLAPAALIEAFSFAAA